MDDLSNLVMMEPVVVCIAETTVESLLTWCKTLGVPRVWVSDTATHFKNAILTRLREALRVDHQFAVAYSPWSNGCLLYTSPSPRDLSTSRMPSSA